jgi:hypothetical protein
MIANTLRHYRSTLDWLCKLIFLVYHLIELIELVKQNLSLVLRLDWGFVVLMTGRFDTVWLCHRGKSFLLLKVLIVIRKHMGLVLAGSRFWDS